MLQPWLRQRKMLFSKYEYAKKPENLIRAGCATGINSSKYSSYDNEAVELKMSLSESSFKSFC